MARTFINGPIIDARAACRHLKSFDAGALAQISKQVRISKGAVLGVVHPLFLNGVLGPDPQRIKNDFLIEIGENKSYPTYISRLKGLIKRTKVPMFVFTQRRDIEHVSDWITKAASPALKVIVPTFRIDPEPDIDGRENGWLWFGDLAKEVGVKKVSLAGEQYYFRREQVLGCVATAFREISYLGLNTEVLIKFAFPNVNIDADPYGRR